MALSNLGNELSYAQARAREDGELDDVQLTLEELRNAATFAFIAIGWTCGWWAFHQWRLAGGL